MKAAIQRYVSSGVLAIWGAVLTGLYFSNRLGDYLNPAFIPWTVVSGIVLLIMAAGTLLLPQGEAGCCDESGESDASHAGEGTFQVAAPLRITPLLKTASADHECCGHDHGGKKVKVVQALILTVPLLVAVTVSPGQFGATAVRNRGYVQSTSDLPGYRPYAEPALPTEDGSPGPTETKPSSDYLPRNAAGQILAQTVDLMYAAEEPTMREDFENKEVEMVGQFMPDKANNASGKRFKLVRLFANCCAADAQPVAVCVETNDPSKPPEMSWVKVVGKATFPLEGGRRVPVVVAENITPCEPPPESFIY